MVYASPEYISTLATSTPIAEHVPVDFELRGCPINKHQLVEVIAAFLARAQAERPDAQRVRRVQAARQRLRHGRAGHAVPRAGHAGRLRRDLPGYDRGCYGCFGPMETPNTVSLTRQLRVVGMGDAGTLERVLPDVQRRRRGVPRRRASAVSARSGRRTIKVDCLARVEGEGAMLVEDRRTARSTRSQLKIYEPPRFFEAFLRGRRFTEAPDITARICGICPVAYQMSAVHAMEDACGVEVDGPLRALRRLLYCGEWIESHALHVFMLHAAGLPRLRERDRAREGPRGTSSSVASS